MPTAQHQEDFFQRIKDVHWGTIPLFVVATHKGKVYRANFKDGDKTKLQSASLPVSRIIYAVGVDYGKVNKQQTFVVAGNHLVAVVNGDTSAGFVCTSRDDGNTWTKSFTTPSGTYDFGGGVTVPWAGSVSAVVYSPDKNTFAFSCEMSRGINLTEEIYESGNGEGWEKSSEHLIASMEEVKANDSTFPSTYCTHNTDCQDDLGHSVPGGIMYRDKRGNQMRPKTPPAVYYWANTIPGNIDYHTLPLTIFGGFDESIGSQPSRIVMIEQFATKASASAFGPSSVEIPGLAIVTCVAGIGKIWLAGGFTSTSEDGGGAVYVTRDGGNTWDFFGSTSSGVVAIAVGEAQ